MKQIRFDLYDEVVVSVPVPVSLVRPGKAGEPMLFAAADRRVRITIDDQGSGSEKWGEILQKALATLRKTFSDINDRWHLGVTERASASPCLSVVVLVGAIAGILYAHRRIWNPVATQEVAYSAIKDEYEEAPAMVAACVAGGIIWSRRELPFLTSTWQLPIRLSPSTQKFSLSKRRGIKSDSRKDTEQDSRNVAIALKNGDEDALRVYYHDGVVSPSCETVLWYGRREGQAIQVGADGMRLESKHT